MSIKYLLAVATGVLYLNRVFCVNFMSANTLAESYSPVHGPASHVEHSMAQHSISKHQMNHQTIPCENCTIHETLLQSSSKLVTTPGYNPEIKDSKSKSHAQSENIQGKSAPPVSKNKNKSTKNNHSSHKKTVVLRK